MSSAIYAPSRSGTQVSKKSLRCGRLSKSFDFFPFPFFFEGGEREEMRIGGFQRFSLIDYPGKICAVVFTQGCNFRCGYCHNPELVPRTEGKISEEAVLSFLERRRSLLDAVTITGGEPLLQEDLADFIERSKKKDFS